MKKFKDILETVYPPKSGDEKNFADKHIVDKKDNPNAAPGQFTSDKKKAKRIADYDEGDDEKVYEAAELHTKRADKEAVVVRAVDPKTGQSKARVVNRGAGEIKIGEEVELDEKAVNPYAVGVAAAMKATGDKPPLKKSTIVKGHEIAKSIKKEAMDPVGKHDADIDNDGDVDKSDKYLIKRRKAISRAVNEGQIDELSKKTLGSYVGKAASRAASDAAKYGMDTGSEKGLKHFNKAYDRLNNVKKAAAKLAKEEIELDELSQDTLNSYHSKAGADRLKAKATVQKTMDMKKPAASTVDKATSAFSRFQKRGKGMTTAANKMSEETDLDEEMMPGNIALRMVDSHKNAAAHHKKNGNMKGYAAHLDVADRIEDAVKRAGRDRLIRSTQIEKASDKAFSNHPHRIVRNEEVDQIDEAFKVGAMHLEDGSSITLTREDVDMLNNLFNQLNSSNKSKMEQRLKSSKNGFNEIITFAKEVV